MIWRTYVAAVVESVAPKPARFKYQREVASETSKIFVLGAWEGGLPGTAKLILPAPANRLETARIARTRHHASRGSIPASCYCHECS
jgi:hypothetical protein